MIKIKELHFNPIFEKLEFIKVILLTIIFFLQSKKANFIYFVIATIIFCILTELYFLFNIRNIDFENRKISILKNIIIIPVIISFLLMGNTIDFLIIIYFTLKIINTILCGYFLYKKHFILNYWLLGVYFIFFVLSVECFFIIPRYDAAQYYKDIIRLKEFNNLYGNWSEFFKLCTHLSYGYSIAMYCALGLSRILRCSDLLAIQIVNYALAIWTIKCLWKIVNTKIKKQLSLQKAIIVLTSIFSPYFLGQFGNISLDYYFMCTLIWFISAEISEENKTRFVYSWFFVFSKEPAIIVYSFYVFFKYCFIFIQDIYNKRFIIQKYLNIELIKYILPAVSFLVKYKYDKIYNTGWAGNMFTITGEYIANKMKQALIANFSWIILLIFIIVIIQTLVNKKIRQQIIQREYLILFTFLFLLLVVNVSLVTYRHWRYIEAIEIIFLLLGLFFINELFKEKISRIAIISIGLLLVIQCFVSIDIVSKKFFNQVNIGKNSLCSMENIYNFSDAIIYNREYIYYNKALERILREIDYTGNEILLCDNIGGNAEYNVAGFMPYWDKSEKRFCVDINENCTPVRFRWIWKNEIFDNDSIVYFIDFPNAEKSIDKYFSEKDILCKNKTVYRTCEIPYYKIDTLCLKPPVYLLGEKLDFSIDGNGVNYSSGNLYSSEDWGAWVGDYLEISFIINNYDYTNNLNLDISCHAIYGNEQPINVYVNDNFINSYAINHLGNFNVEIPLEYVKNNNQFINLKFIFPKASSPKDDGIGEDVRKLSIALSSLVVK